MSKGQRHKDSDVRRLAPDYSYVKPVTAQGKTVIDLYRSGWLNQYRENWSVLGLPEAVSF